MTGGTRLSCLGLAAAALISAAPPVSAQQAAEEEYYVPELRTGGRSLIGAGGGLGIFDGLCGGCKARGAAAFEFYAGWQFHPRLAVILDIWSTVHFLPSDSDNPGVAGYSAFTVAAQTWITPIVFTRVGAGMGAGVIVSKVTDTFDPGPTVSVTVGGELGHRKNSGIDLSLRLSGGPVDTSALGDSIFYSVAAMISYHRN